MFSGGGKFGREPNYKAGIFPEKKVKAALEDEPGALDSKSAPVVGGLGNLGEVPSLSSSGPVGNWWKLASMVQSLRALVC